MIQNLLLLRKLLGKSQGVGQEAEKINKKKQLIWKVFGNKGKPIFQIKCLIMIRLSNSKKWKKCTKIKWNKD